MNPGADHFSRAARRATRLSGAWAQYLGDFHAARTGITEDVLSRARAGGDNPYRWLGRSVGANARMVLDIGCGSGAMSRELARPDRIVIGLDISAAELDMAADRSPGPWVRADGRRLPLGDRTMDAVTTSLGLAVIHPIGDLVSEVARVLVPGGVFAAMAPTLRTLTRSDARIGFRLAQILRTPPRFPAPLEVTVSQVLALHGLRKVEDARELYHFRVTTRQDAERLIDSLYLPVTDRARVVAAADWLESAVVRHGHVLVPVPMRRIVALK